METPTNLPTADRPEKKISAGIIAVIGAMAAVLLGGLYWFAWRERAKERGPGPAGPDTRTTMEKNEAAALGVVYGTLFCLENYLRSNPASGYPAAVEQMGPSGSDCLDAGWTDRIAQGDPVSGYIITYTPVPLEGRNAGFELQARPNRFAVDGVNSFFLDEPDYYLLRVTARDRAARKDDPLYY